MKISLYRSREITVSGHQYPTLPEHTIDREGLPFDNGFFSKAAFIVRSSQSRPTAEGIRYSQIGSRHGRSLELTHTSHEGPSSLAVWADKYGNRFTSIGTKGAVGLDTKPRYRANIVPSFTVNGLLEGDSVDRVVAASRALRAVRIDTEWPVSVITPDHIPAPPRRLPIGDNTIVKMVRQKEFAKSALRRARFELFKKGPTAYIRDHKNLIEEHEGRRFVVMHRCTSCPYRLNDLGSISYAMSKYNLVRKAWPEGSETTYPELDFDSDADYEYFVDTVLPSRLGKNTALMALLGASHGYLHPGNITMHGGIVDLDSVDGPFSGEEANVMQIAGDCVAALRSLRRSRVLPRESDDNSINVGQRLQVMMKEYIHTLLNNPTENIDRGELLVAISARSAEFFDEVLSSEAAGQLMEAYIQNNIPCIEGISNTSSETIGEVRTSVDSFFDNSKQTASDWLSDQIDGHLFNLGHAEEEITEDIARGLVTMSVYFTNRKSLAPA